MKTKQSGFTLTELVVVITIVGILAAVAVPKFVSLSADARAGVIKSTAGSMRQANDTILAKASLANVLSLSSGASGASVSYPGVSGGIVTHYGYAKDATELAKAMSFSLDGDVAVGSGGSSIYHTKAQVATTCKVEYAQAADSTTAPVYTIVVSDCS